MKLEDVNKDDFLEVRYVVVKNNEDIPFPDWNDEAGPDFVGSPIAVMLFLSRLMKKLQPDLVYSEIQEAETKKYVSLEELKKLVLNAIFLAEGIKCAATT